MHKKIVSAAQKKADRHGQKQSVYFAMIPRRLDKQFIHRLEAGLASLLPSLTIYRNKCTCRYAAASADLFLLALQNKQLKAGELRTRAEQNLKMSESEVSTLRQDLDTANRRIKNLHLEMFLNSEPRADLNSEDEEVFGN